MWYVKCRIFDAICRQLVADARAVRSEDVDASPGGHCGASHISSAAGFHPHTDTSDQPLPGPAPTTLPPRLKPRKTATDGHLPATG
jgi:hypothetical protein